MYSYTVGSICSGIEAASVAWKPLGFKFEWFSEIAEFPSQVLNEKYKNICNLGDMRNIPTLITENKIAAPDILCGGTPCQAFSLAGWKNGLDDDRGNLTLQFVDIVEANDSVREKNKQEQSIVFWENVEGVLKDKTNAFGCLVSSLAGLDQVMEVTKWPNSGLVRGPKRNVAWRVLDGKYFGIPQQRRRLYLVAGGIDFFPENILFEEGCPESSIFPSNDKVFEKDGHKFEIFREYTDCLYAAYGTKWNGNAAAYNGSLFVVQDGKIRRLSPLECERLMGFPDNYTNLVGSKRTPRYQAIGNSWAVPVIKWFGKRFREISHSYSNFNIEKSLSDLSVTEGGKKFYFWNFSKVVIDTVSGKMINTSEIPKKPIFGDMKDIVESNAPDNIYISPVGCYGIVRRKNERKLKMDLRLEEILIEISSQMSSEEIEKRSRVQKRGRFSTNLDQNDSNQDEQLSLF